MKAAEWLKHKRASHKSLGRITMGVLIPLALLFAGVMAVTFRGMIEMKQLVFRYIEDTAALRVEQINSSINKINYEIISLQNRSRNLSALPADLRPDDSEWYPLLNDIWEQNRSLKIRYKETYSFYVYPENARVLILDGGTYFTDSIKNPLYSRLMERLAEKSGEMTVYSEWEIIGDGSRDYLYSRYVKNGVAMGCVISLDDLFAILSINSLGYEGIPLIQMDDGTRYIASAYKGAIDLDVMLAEARSGSAALNGRTIYTFRLQSVKNGKLILLLTPSGGLLERILNLQLALVILAVGVLSGSILGVRIYYRRILTPMKQFVNGLKNVEEEQWINENGVNNVLELEMASKEFKNLLRKIKSLKIAIYEKELSRQKTELEHMQERIKPHFYLNCLSLIHGMADVDHEERIVEITEKLSHHMRYVIRDSFEPGSVRQELAFIRNYVEIQQLRYGKDAFSFEVIMEEDVGDCEIPILLLQTFVENSMTHAVSLDTHIDITIYLVTETYDGEERLYISLSDTGKGFSHEVLQAIEREQPIYYDNRRHIGIQNTMKRLQIIYGDRAQIRFSNMGEHYGAVVEITLPAVR